MSLPNDPPLLSLSLSSRPLPPLPSPSPSPLSIYLPIYLSSFSSPPLSPPFPSPSLPLPPLPSSLCLPPAPPSFPFPPSFPTLQGMLTQAQLVASLHRQANCSFFTRTLAAPAGRAGTWEGATQCSCRRCDPADPARTADSDRRLGWQVRMDGSGGRLGWPTRMADSG